MDKLPKVFKAKWLRALRSGKFEKGCGCLYRSIDKSFCCLGIACVVGGFKNLDKMEKYGYIKPFMKGKIPDCIIGDTEIAMELTDLNDNNVTFKRVINYIEKHL